MKNTHGFENKNVTIPSLPIDNQIFFSMNKDI